MKIKTVSTLGIASLALVFSACGGAVNTTTNTTTTNVANNSNTAVVVNTNQTTTTTMTNSVNTASSPSANSNANANKTSTAVTPAAKSNAEKPAGEKIAGQLHFGKAGSYILYVGMESGDYAAYCFANESEAGRSILAACKDGDQCEFVGEVADDSTCKAPGLEADLSASGKITKVTSVKSLGRQK